MVAQLAHRVGLIRSARLRRRLERASVTLLALDALRPAFPAAILALRAVTIQGASWAGERCADRGGERDLDVHAGSFAVTGSASSEAGHGAGASSRVG